MGLCVGSSLVSTAGLSLLPRAERCPSECSSSTLKRLCRFACVDRAQRKLLVVPRVCRPLFQARSSVTAVSQSMEGLAGVLGMHYHGLLCLASYARTYMKSFRTDLIVIHELIFLVYPAFLAALSCLAHGRVLRVACLIGFLDSTEHRPTV